LGETVLERGLNDCCVKSVPQSDSSYETFAGPVADWQARLTAGLSQSIQAAEETLGHLEEQILQQTRGLERRLLEGAAQKKADQTPPVCPVCGHKLSRRTHDHPRRRGRFTRTTLWRSAATGSGASGQSVGDCRRRGVDLEFGR